MADRPGPPTVFAVVGVGPVCAGCLTVVEVDAGTLGNEQVRIMCHRCAWSGTVEKVFASVANVQPFTPPPAWPDRRKKG